MVIEGEHLLQFQQKQKTRYIFLAHNCEYIGLNLGYPIVLHRPVVVIKLSYYYAVRERVFQCLLTTIPSIN